MAALGPPPVPRIFSTMEEGPGPGGAEAGEVSGVRGGVRGGVPGRRLWGREDP